MKFERTYKIDDIYFYIDYTGLNKNNEDVDKKLLILDQLCSFKRSTIEVITYIRTLFRNFEEKSLKINYQNGKSEVFTFEDTVLKEYRYYSHRFHLNSSSIVYEKNKGLDFNYRKDGMSLESNHENKLLKEQMSDVIDQLNRLCNIRKTELTSEHILLMKLYELFFGEKLDFEDKDMYIKAQSMLYVLDKHHIHVSSYQDFIDINGTIKSFYIDKLIDEIALYQDENIDISCITIDNEKKVKQIGKEIVSIFNPNYDELYKLCYIDKVKYKEKIILDNEVQKRLSLINS